MKNKKIWVGIVGFIVLFIIEFLNGMLSAGIEGCEECGIWLPIWLYKLLNPLWIIFLIIFLWGIVELIIRKYKSKI
ncbi:MAG TPA: hypothetical protein P5232_03660 [Candidatus Moranbacteria bacterium]|nr:hypothetical protein [Candidatus Moranbacteria bacterium]